jgi:hypothetical protein
MKKIAFLGGVAAFSLIASAAAAGPAIYQGSVSIPTFFGPVDSNNALAVGGGQLANFLAPGSTSVFVIQGGAANNIGTANTTDTNTFSLTGSVTPDCSFYVGNASKSINLGQIGVQTNPNTGLNAAFDMVAPASVDIDTSVAGCNTRNTVTISKSNAAGLVSDNTSNFDLNQFTNVLPYDLKASWTGVAVGANAVGSNQNLALLANNANAQASIAQGAWKSAVAIDIDVPVPSKSLVAGNYSGSVTIELKVL